MVSFNIIKAYLSLKKAGYFIPTDAPVAFSPENKFQKRPRKWVPFHSLSSRKNLFLGAITSPGESETSGSTNKNPCCKVQHAVFYRPEILQTKIFPFVPNIPNCL